MPASPRVSPGPTSECRRPARHRGRDGRAHRGRPRCPRRCARARRRGCRRARRVGAVRRLRLDGSLARGRRRGPPPRRPRAPPRPGRPVRRRRRVDPLPRRARRRGAADPPVRSSGMPSTPTSTSSCADAACSSAARSSPRPGPFACSRRTAGSCGARLELPDGAIREVRAAATVIATGGFQGDPELRAAHVHPNAATIPLRSNPASRGDGLRLAREAGAATGPDGAGFYGHLIPSGVPFADSGDFVGLSLYYSEHALLFNLANERFVDESARRPPDHDGAARAAGGPRPAGRGRAGAPRLDRAGVRRRRRGSDKFAVASRRGGRCGVAESLDELALLPEEWGYDGQAIAAADRRLQRDGRGRGRPQPGRKLDRLPLDEPPYYVIEADPGDHVPVLRHPDRQQCARPRTTTARRSPACSPPAPTPAACSSAPTPAASPTPWSSASPRPAPRSVRPTDPSRNKSDTDSKEHRMSVPQRTAIVTGGARGIGAAVSRQTGRGRVPGRGRRPRRVGLCRDRRCRRGARQQGHRRRRRRLRRGRGAGRRRPDRRPTWAPRRCWSTMPASPATTCSSRCRRWTGTR